MIREFAAGCKPLGVRVKLMVRGSPVQNGTKARAAEVGVGELEQDKVPACDASSASLFLLRGAPAQICPSPSVRLRNMSFLTRPSPQVACCLVSSGWLLPPCAGDAVDAAGQGLPGRGEQEGAAASPRPDGSAALHRAAVQSEPIVGEPSARRPGAGGPVQATSSAAAEGASSDGLPSGGDGPPAAGEGVPSEPADEIAKAREDLRAAARKLRLSLRRLFEVGIRLPRAPPEGHTGRSTLDAKAESTGAWQAQQTSPVKRTWSELGLRGIVWRAIVVALSPLVCIPRPSSDRF